ncbi:MAG: metal-dependent hydrolase [Cytophagales bacterium]|nr:metal-dependent hydrolase [Cytophagales bacterium]
MDSITHFALGACLGELIATKRIGKKALLLGALAQSIPDFDFIFSLWMDPSSNVLAHRGFTHSFLFGFLLTPLLAWIFHRGWGSTRGTFKFWLVFFGTQIFTHIILDAFNAYGTGWFEPFSHYRVSFHTLFVADPLFSISIGVATLVLIFSSTDNKNRTRWALGAILISMFYLSYGLFNKYHVDGVSKNSLTENIVPTQYFSTPTPFNTWLWFVVANTDSGSYVGYRSVFDQNPTIDFRFFKRHDSLIYLVNDKMEVNRLKRFSQGYYTFEQKGDTLIFNDLRFGQMIGWRNPDAGFVFHYYLQPQLDNQLVLQRGRFTDWDWQATEDLLTRIKGNN